MSDFQNAQGVAPAHTWAHQGNNQNISFAASSVAGSAIPREVKVLILYATELCHVALGKSAGALTATANDTFIPAGQLIPIHLNQDNPGVGNDYQISVIQNSTGGTLQINYGY